MNGLREMQDNPPQNLSKSVKFLWDRFYRDYNEGHFIEYMSRIVQMDMHVLEIGAGSGSGLQAIFPIRNRVARYVGIDLDPRVLNNQHLDEAVVADGASIPFPDESFDIVFHRMVAEHLENPEKSISESARVLKTSGRLIFETPSKYYYAMLLSIIFPLKAHQWLVGKLGSGRTDTDVFPTFYRMNDRRNIERLVSGAGLKFELEYRATPPGYLRFHPATFLVGIAFERTLERWIPQLRARIWVTATKIGPTRPSVAGTPADRHFENGAWDTPEHDFKGVHGTGSTPTP